MIRKHLFFALICGLIFSGACCKPGSDVTTVSAPPRELPQDTDKWRGVREKMVTSQIEKRNVRNPKVLAAMRKVPRHFFVPVEHRRKSYNDHPLPIGENQTISQPYIVAKMTELLDLSGGERVLEIGTGSGYQAAVLAEIAGEVYTIEIVPKLGQSAEKRLEEMGYTNIHVKIGDGYQGWPDAAPFDAIIVTAAPPFVPQPLIKQLKVGARMVVPVGKGFQELVIVTRKEEGYESRKVFPVRFVPMTGEAQKASPQDTKKK